MKKKLIKGILFAAILAPITTFAANMNDVTLEISPSSGGGGAWVQVLQDGLPVDGATVNGFETNANGRVFVYTLNDGASSVLFQAETPSGGTAERYAFISRQQ